MHPNPFPNRPSKGGDAQSLGVKSRARVTERVAERVTERVTEKELNHSKSSLKAQSKDFLARMKAAFKDEDIDAAITTLRECMQATHHLYDKDSRQWVEKPDFRVRLDAARSVLANTAGEPVKRQEIVTVHVESTGDLAQKAASSQALQDAAQRILIRRASESRVAQVSEPAVREAEVVVSGS